jgi:hypothetical protein
MCNVFNVFNDKMFHIIDPVYPNNDNAYFDLMVIVNLFSTFEPNM